VDPGKWSALAPVIDGLGLGPSGPVESIAKIVEDRVGHLDAERSNGDVVGHEGRT
jgi:hypothetical protein